jgi:hypothetical protein
MRASFEFALKNFKINSAVEVGVYEGENAESMLRQAVGFLHLVDPYKAHVNNGIDTDRPTYPVTQEDMDRARALALRRLSPYAGRFRLLEKASVEASQDFENDSIDFIYVDSIHSYEQVKKDIETWFPKVRPGGILGGHDYAMGSHPWEVGYVGLMRAVDEFAREKGLRLYAVGADWWVVK